MPSPAAELAIADALKAGKAIAKFISRNDVGETGGHQCGFYLPTGVWSMFTADAPEKGENKKSDVRVLWQDGTVTESVITWYGRGTRSEYRLTRFGRDFRYLNGDNVGNLLVLIPWGEGEFRAYVLDTDEDIEAIQSALGLQILTTWGSYEKGVGVPPETEDDCIDRHFRAFVNVHADFPPSAKVSEAVRAAVIDCVQSFAALSPDDRLMTWIEQEYRLFRLLERKVCQGEITNLFKDIDDFLRTAATIMNRRKARAGLSLENHVECLLRESGIPFESQADVDGRPDILIPSAAAYSDRTYPEDQIIAVGLKTTCKDRWRQILNEAKRVKRKHILTLQPGISAKQLAEMKAANVTLIVPEALQKEYATSSGIELLSVRDFIAKVRGLLSNT